MQPNSSDNFFSQKNSLAYTQRWQIAARGGLTVHVEWQVEGASVQGCVFADGQESVQPFSLNLPNNSCVMLELRAHSETSVGMYIELKLNLSSDQRTAELICTLPLNSSEYFDGPIARWLVHPDPAPASPF